MAEASPILRLTRAYLPDGSATLGRLSLGDWHCLTLELPWRDNERGKSCIPEGVYPLRWRRSQVVSRTSGGKFNAGWEVCEVPDRDWIMIHPGNYRRDTDGCILPGRQYWIDAKAGPMVTSSRSTFSDFMIRMSEAQPGLISISSCAANCKDSWNA